MRTSIEEKTVNGITLVGKVCSKCKEWKELNLFGTQKRGLAGRRSRCKKCESDYHKKWKAENWDSYKVENAERIKEKHREWVKNNPEASRERSRRWMRANKEKNRAKMNKWQKVNLDRRRVNNQRRIARKRSLPDTFTDEQRLNVLNYFENGCAFTGDKEIHWDHVIPLSLGIEGTVMGNMIPLRKDLNVSKSNQNIFEWFNENKTIFNLSQNKFKFLIAYLAGINNMKEEEYQDYVYRCFETP